MTDREFVVAGLEAPVEVLLDRWGVPHIYAGSTSDAVRAQGFTAARDRLWQLDFWRRRGLGLLAEAFGPSLVERDRAARLFLYRGEMSAEWSSYGEDAERIVTAFVEGVNAWIARVRADPDLLPVEFRELGYLPGWWSPEDVPRIRSSGLYSNLDEEVARALVLRDFGPAVEELCRRRDRSGDLVVPDGLDLSVIPDDVLAVYRLAIDPPDLSGAGPPPRLPEGSNNWVLAPSRTTTGRPLLANDPHRAVTVPSLRYLAHLSAPGLDVIGAGEPALPGISIGHNGRLAFGLTIFPVDQEDLYVYETAPGDRMAYRYADGWERMSVVRETVPVRGGDPVEVELRFTRHGPVIGAHGERDAAFAVRAAWLSPGCAPYLGGLRLMRASTPAELVDALAGWGTPPENQVFAAADAAIGWRPAGRTPVRPGWDGALPVPGDGRYEWAGFLDPDELPLVLDPERGWLATANEMNLPPDAPPVGVDWYADTRARRIAEVLEGSARLSAQDCLRLQSDVVSLPARRILRRLARVPGGDPEHLLIDWDCRLSPESGAAALFEVWLRRHLRPALLRRALEQLVPAERVDDALRAALPEESLMTDARIVLDLVEAPADRFGPDSAAVLDDLLRASLADAVADVVRLLGPDRDSWAWGRLHVARLTHPLAGLLEGPTAPRRPAAAAVTRSAVRPTRRTSSRRTVRPSGSWSTWGSGTPPW